MKKIKLIISDFHICDGARLPNGAINTLEDFKDDQRFVEFLDHYSKPPFSDDACELVINGDFMNLIQVCYMGQTPTEITEEISMNKLEQIFSGHVELFQALKRFNSKPNRTISYIPGNHDIEMMWPALRKRFNAHVGGVVRWFSTHYVEDGVHVEHGHQFELTNKIDVKRMFSATKNGASTLNLPWGALFHMNVLMRFKKKQPAIDRVRPFRAYIILSLFTNPLFVCSLFFSVMTYFVRTYFEKHSFHSRIRTTFRIVNDFFSKRNLDDVAERILKRHPSIHTVVFGHTHVYRMREILPNRIYLNTGTWNPITSLDVNQLGQWRRFTFACIVWEDGDTQKIPTRQIKIWNGSWKNEDEAFE